MGGLFPPLTLPRTGLAQIDRSTQKDGERSTDHRRVFPEGRLARAGLGSGDTLPEAVLLGSMDRRIRTTAGRVVHLAGSYHTLHVSHGSIADRGDRVDQLPPGSPRPTPTSGRSGSPTSSSWWAWPVTVVAGHKVPEADDDARGVRSTRRGITWPLSTSRREELVQGGGRRARHDEVR